LFVKVLSVLLSMSLITVTGSVIDSVFSLTVNRLSKFLDFNISFNQLYKPNRFSSLSTNSEEIN